jgi:hypothetical protein
MTAFDYLLPHHQELYLEAMDLFLDAVPRAEYTRRLMSINLRRKLAEEARLRAAPASVLTASPARQPPAPMSVPVAPQQQQTPGPHVSVLELSLGPSVALSESGPLPDPVTPPAASVGPAPAPVSVTATVVASPVPRPPAAATPVTPPAKALSAASPAKAPVAPPVTPRVVPTTPTEAELVHLLSTCVRGNITSAMAQRFIGISLTNADLAHYFGRDADKELRRMAEWGKANHMPIPMLATGNGTTFSIEDLRQFGENIALIQERTGKHVPLYLGLSAKMQESVLAEISTATSPIFRPWSPSTPAAPPTT